MVKGMTHFQDTNYVAGVDKDVYEHRADSFSNKGAYTTNAEIRWVEEGHHAFFLTGTKQRRFEIVSDTELGVRYNLTAEARKVGGEFLIYVICDCKSGQNRDHLPIPCKHAAGVARRLVRERFAVVGADGVFRLHPELVPAPPTNCTKCGADLAPGHDADLCTDCIFGLFS